MKIHEGGKKADRREVGRKWEKRIKKVHEGNKSMIRKVQRINQESGEKVNRELLNKDLYSLEDAIQHHQLD